MTFEQSRTRENLLSAFAAECQTLAMLEFAAKVAKKDGYIEISNTLTLMAAHERSHSKNFFKAAGRLPGIVPVQVTPLSQKSTVDFLTEAATLKRIRGNELYTGWSQIASEEGFDEAAVLLRAIANAERRHADMLEERSARIAAGQVFSRPEKVLWMCTKCGFTHEGNEALAKCPGCGHPRDWFEVVKAL